MELHGQLPFIVLLLGFCCQAGAAALDEPIKPISQTTVEDPRRVELGRRLFNDVRLSANGGVSCASCHQLERGGADS